MIDGGEIRHGPSFGPMSAVKRNSLRPEAAVGRRVRQVQFVLGFQTAASLALFLGISESRLSNIFNGTSLSLDVARRLRERTGVTLDWLYYGDVTGLPSDLLRRLHEADTQISD